jgi:hypothetical protein
MTAIRINVLPRVWNEAYGCIDYMGARHGDFVMLDFSFIRPSDGRLYWLCRCTHCGCERYHRLGESRRRCGCQSKSKVCYFPSTYEGHPDYKRLVNIFSGMLRRCDNPFDDSFLWYGERGITVCDEWRKDRDAFIRWALNNGYAMNLTIDRKDNYRGYEPSNCRFVTMEENLRNKRIHQDARGGSPA